MAQPFFRQRRTRVLTALAVILCLIAAVAFFLPRLGGREGILVQLTSTPSPTPTVLGVQASRVVHLRVETQQLDTQYGIWRRMPGVPIFLSPYRGGDVAPDAEREGTLRQVTEELITADGVRVAVATFDPALGLYWVWVDELNLPLDCMVWLPVLETDANRIYVSPWKIIDLVLHGDFNTTVVKFQIVCGLAPREEVQSPTATVPLPSSTPPTPVVSTPCVDCETPSTPVPTPTAYPTDRPTPTSVFND